MSNECAFFTMFRDEWQGGDMLGVLSFADEAVTRTVALFLSDSRADGEIRFVGKRKCTISLTRKKHYCSCQIRRDDA